MTTKPKNNGGPAFPESECAWAGGRHCSGMTLRDWFAGMALNGMLCRIAYNEPWAGAEFHAALAYQIADAMLAERDKA